jgi:hypothetical protein
MIATHFVFRLHLPALLTDGIGLECSAISAFQVGWSFHKPSKFSAGGALPTGGRAGVTHG